MKWRWMGLNLLTQHQLPQRLVLRLRKQFHGLRQQEVYEAEKFRTTAAVLKEIFQHGKGLACSRWLWGAKIPFLFYYYSEHRQAWVQMQLAADLQDSAHCLQCQPAAKRSSERSHRAAVGCTVISSLDTTMVTPRAQLSIKLIMWVILLEKSQSSSTVVGSPLQAVRLECSFSETQGSTTCTER